MKHKYFLFLFTSVLLIACGTSQDEADKMIFRMNLEGGLASLDPAFARDKSTIWMTSQIYNGLVELDQELKIKPAIARDWIISDSGKTYTFILRDDVFFHPNDIFGPDSTRRVVAEDFRYSFTRIANPATASSGQWIFNEKIAGLQDYYDKKVTDISGFQAIGNDTFRIRLTKPFPPFLSLLAMPYGYVVPREAVDKWGTDYRSHPVGTGPFMIKSWNEGFSLILHKNPLYYEQEGGRALPYLDAVHVRFIDSRLSAFVEFTQGKLDFINGIDPSYKDEILTPGGEIRPEYEEKYQFFLSPQLNTEYLGFMVDSTKIADDHPLADVRVRKALNYAINRENLVNYLLNGISYAGTSGFVPKGMPGFDPEAVEGYAYDPQKSADLLAEAGYPGGKGLPVIKLRTTPQYQNIAEFIQKSFENIGVSLDIESMESAALREMVYNSEARFWRASWIADYPDAENYLSLFYSGNHAPNGPNTTHFKDARYDALYDSIMTITDDSLRIRLYHKMENIMLGQAPVIILYYDRIIRIVQPDVEGLETNPMNHLFLKRVKKSLG